LTEKSYNRQRTTIIAIIVVAVILMVAAIVGIIVFSNNTKPMVAGDDTVTVGNYLGKNYVEISSKDLEFEKVEVFSNEAKGVVIQQSIAEGTTVKKGTVITLNISKGDSEVEVPQIVGKSEAEAVKALKDNGFEVIVHYLLNYEEKYEGTVKECVPAAGEKVSFGSTVTIKVWGDDLMVTTTTTSRPTQETAPTTQPTTQPTTLPTTLPTTEPTTEPTTQPTTVGTTTVTTTEAEVQTVAEGGQTE